MCRCLGDLPFKTDGKEVVDCTPEMRRIELQPGDSAVVLATDGLWDVLSDSDVVSIVTKVCPPPMSWSSCEYISFGVGAFTVSVPEQRQRFHVGLSCSDNIVLDNYCAFGQLE